MAVTIYGIKNCDTMKKAFAWLGQHGVDYVFHDYRVDGIAKADIRRWSKTVGWEKLLNKSSTTFRALSDAEKADLDEAKAIDLMVAQPTMIKRPVLDTGKAIEVGFKPERYQDVLSA